jgi:hypothetical protein
MELTNDVRVKGRRWRWMKVSATDEANPGQELAFGNSILSWMAANSPIHRHIIDKPILSATPRLCTLDLSWRRTVPVADSDRIFVLEMCHDVPTVEHGSVCNPPSLFSPPFSTPTLAAFQAELRNMDSVSAPSAQAHALSVAVLRQIKAKKIKIAQERPRRFNLRCNVARLMPISAAAADTLPPLRASAR